MTGQPDLKTARSIVQEAWESGISEFDTAQAYGQSEQVLGHALKDLGITNKAQVITKLSPFINYLDRSNIDNAIRVSIDNLGVESLYGLMLHREDMLDLWGKGLGRYLMDIVGSGTVKHLGISVYSPRRAIQALETEGISIVQLPSNVIDRRFEKAGVFELADDMGKTIYIRSIFLQGLLLMSPDTLPKHMRFTIPVLTRVISFAQNLGLSVKSLCIGYIKNAFPHARIVFGAEASEQVRENLKYWAIPWPIGLNPKIRTEFRDIDEMILNPSLWPKENDNNYS